MDDDTIDANLMSAHSLSTPKLPEEVVRTIMTYMDIASIASIVQTGRQTTESMFSTLLLSDQVWAKFVETRFKIKCDRKRPKTYGGATWKTAFRSLMMTNRVPRCRLIAGTQKVVFAKPFFGNFEKRCNKYAEYFDDPQPRDDSIAPSSAGASLWVTIGHTENRNTRVTSQRRWSSSESKSSRNRNVRHDRARRPYVNEERQRYIELHLCLQNTKSSGGTVSADFANSQVQFIYCRDGDFEIRNVSVKSVGEFGPKLLYHSRYDKSDDKAKNSDILGDSSLHEDESDSLDENSFYAFEVTLEAFEFAVVSLNIPCHSGMVYETDFLSQAVLMNVPVNVNRGRTMDTDAYHQAFNPKFAGIVNRDSTLLASAAFLAEDDIWKYYMELPGGFLAGVDPHRALGG